MSEAAAQAEPIAGLTQCRAFRLSDAMVLLAGVALALAAGAHLLLLLADMLSHLCREVAARRADLFEHWPLFWGATQYYVRNTLSYGFQASEMFIVGMTPAFFVLRLRRPRPAPRALLCQPGTVAGLAIVFGLLWGTGGLLLLFPSGIDSMTAAPIAIASTVALGWGFLGLSRMWTPEAGWIDLMGRVLGCAAIGAGLLALTAFRI